MWGSGCELLRLSFLQACHDTVFVPCSAALCCAVLCCALLCFVMLCRAQIEELQQSLLLSMLPHDEEDEGNVILEVRSSVGGEWAGGFAADLLEMYRLFAAEQGWRFTVSDWQGVLLDVCSGGGYWTAKIPTWLTHPP